MSDASPPDLTTPEGRDAYKRELRHVAAPLRMTGLAIVIFGALLAIASRFFWRAPAWIDGAVLVILAAGWIVLFYVIFLRSQYHRRRMGGR